ncbi:MAG TPA: allantoicase [Pyrinomonadaceae bacterium]|jgi:allantoicase|nr:allantoicase [Pyrinomonadaceae bacterium]
MDFKELVDLAGERLGGAVLYASDEFFAPKENLLRASQPVFIEGKYTDLGKWMDGWESRRRRTPGYDWCLIRLGLAGRIHGVIVDTSHFKGNYPEHCSLEACAVEGHQGTVERLTDPSTVWTEILPVSKLQGDALNPFGVQDAGRFTHLRFRIYPDGGVARLRVYGEVMPDWPRLARRGGELDLAAVEHGGLVLSCSDMFFGHRHNLIMPGRALNMSDGWETKRRRGPGHDWVVIRLGTRGRLRRLEVDTSHFKGNFPESCSLEGVDAPAGKASDEAAAAITATLAWKEILPRALLQAHTRHFFEEELADVGPSTHLRFNIYPDGGVSRLRAMGVVEGREGF